MTSTEAWLELLEGSLRPKRPGLERCLREAALHDEAGRPVAKARAEAVARCVAQIHGARAAVFAADDGAVPRRMTELEREWLTLSRTDQDGETMGLWARLAPASWLDQKRWRGNSPAAQRDVAIALAADVAGVEAAEAAVKALRAALGAWGVALGGRIVWQTSAAHGGAEPEIEPVATWLAAPLLAAQTALGPLGEGTTLHEKAERIQQSVQAAAHARFPARPRFAEGFGYAARVDFVLRAAQLDGRPNPVSPLRDLWKTGYGLVAFDASGATLEVPPL